MMWEGSYYTNEEEVDYPEKEGADYIQGTGYITTLDTGARYSPKKRKRKKKIPFGFQAQAAKKKKS